MNIQVTGWMPEECIVIRDALREAGFDEAGEHGFVVLDIDETSGSSDTYFVPFARRNIYVAQVDVTGCENTFEIEKRVRSFLEMSGYTKESLVKVELTGALDVECEKTRITWESSLRENSMHLR